VIYLLDVNVLLALGCDTHAHHDSAERWIGRLLRFDRGIPNALRVPNLDGGGLEVREPALAYGTAA